MRQDAVKPGAVSGLSALWVTSGDRRCHRVVRAARAAFGGRFMSSLSRRHPSDLFRSLGLQRDPNDHNLPYRIRLPPAFLCHQQTRMRCASNA